jgi:hypothetical protein
LFSVKQEVQVDDALQVLQRAEHLEQTAVPASKNPWMQAQFWLLSRVVLSAQVLQMDPTEQVAQALGQVLQALPFWKYPGRQAQTVALLTAAP